MVSQSMFQEIVERLFCAVLTGAGHDAIWAGVIEIMLPGMVEEESRSIIAATAAPHHPKVDIENYLHNVDC